MQQADGMQPANGIDASERVRLVAIDAGNWRDAVAVRVLPEQLRFVADHQPVALVSLAKSYVRPGDRDWVPLAICHDGEIVGLVTLAYSAPEPSECELLHFVIDHRSQGRGLGKQAMHVIVGHVRRTMPSCHSLILTVDTDNLVARRLYEPFGFVATGMERAGDPLLRMQL